MRKNCEIYGSLVQPSLPVRLRITPVIVKIAANAEDIQFNIAHFRKVMIMYLHGCYVCDMLGILE